MSKEFHLHSGQSIVLYELRPYFTCEGLLEGLPTTEMNQRTIQALMDAPKNRSYNVPPYLIPPIEKPVPFHGEKYSFGTPSALPSITCIARFISHQPTKKGKGDLSGLSVIWFQGEFAFPIEQEIIEQLESMDWDSNAGNKEWCATQIHLRRCPR